MPINIMSLGLYVYETKKTKISIEVPSDQRDWLDQLFPSRLIKE